MDDFYPHPPRGGRHLAELQNIMMRAISIHALREEGDDPSAGRWRRVHNFYPRPPRGGRRLSCRHLLDAVQISIHALREEGDRRRSASTIALKLFLSTPSARRATRFCWRPGGGPWHFYPRPPRGGRLLDFDVLIGTDEISIHALREEGDLVIFFLFLLLPISIHALREEGDGVKHRCPVKLRQFLSTPSARRATCQGMLLRLSL